MVRLSHDDDSSSSQSQTREPTPPPPDEDEEEAEAEWQEMLQARVNRAIELAAAELDALNMDDYGEIDVDRLAKIQRAAVELRLSQHDQEEEQLREDVEESLRNLQGAQKLFLSFANEVDALDADLAGRAEMDEKELEIITQYTEKEKQSRLEHRKQAERKHLECERAAEKAVLEKAGPIGAEEQIAELRSKVRAHQLQERDPPQDDAGAERQAPAPAADGRHWRGHLKSGARGASGSTAAASRATRSRFMQGQRPAGIDGIPEKLPVDKNEYKDLCRMIAEMEAAADEAHDGFLDAIEAAKEEAREEVLREAAELTSQIGQNATEAAAQIHMYKTESSSRKKKLDKLTLKHAALSMKFNKEQEEHTRTKASLKAWCERHEAQRLRGDKHKADLQKAQTQSRDLTDQLESHKAKSAMSESGKVKALEEELATRDAQFREARDKASLLEYQLEQEKEASKKAAAEADAEQQRLIEAHKAEFAEWAELKHKTELELEARLGREKDAMAMAFAGELWNAERDIEAAVAETAQHIELERIAQEAATENARQADRARQAEAEREVEMTAVIELMAEEVYTMEGHAEGREKAHKNEVKERQAAADAEMRAQQAETQKAAEQQTARAPVARMCSSGRRWSSTSTSSSGSSS